MAGSLSPPRGPKRRNTSAGNVLSCGWLDGDQRDVVIRLTTAGAFLDVLAAPAGAGKTTTLGAYAQLWRENGIDVLGLAPTARAAAELAAATGGAADALAKWAHEHAGGNAWLTAGTVVVVDEASRADTFTLDHLISAAGKVRAKLVLVGDPAQPGVIDGPGGLLALLAEHGHGVELSGVRRFVEAWERDTSLALRAGDPAAITDYAGHRRLHPAASRDEALDPGLAQWTAETLAGRDALMLTRTRTDADALNARARAAAIDAGTVTGPPARLAGQDWQAGDLLRARRNDRRIDLAGSYLRNGDRFRVVAAGADGLVVDDLPGRGRVWLPAGYLERHADHGWATTIDTAQGATTDVGILHATAGLDREHLYVGLTRGRQANHVYVDATPADAEIHHLPTRVGATLADAVDALTRAAARSGVAPAAHAARDRATSASRNEPARTTMSEEEFAASLCSIDVNLGKIIAALAQRTGDPASLSTASLGHDPYLHPDRELDWGMGRGR
jgi:ATP-dependent exoDNAse (exonuclease V) alpha subunit